MHTLYIVALQQVRPGEEVYAHIAVMVACSWMYSTSLECLLDIVTRAAVWVSSADKEEVREC